ncbi:MAG: glycoside hydrolase family 57 protein [Calditrichia bacterium]
MSNKKIALAILWHQHQPFYKNSSGFYQMPWVRFHGTKDYLDMLLVLKEFPQIKQNINLVPSLLLQIQDYVENGAKDNIWLLTEKPAEKLTLEDKEKILENFFLANVNSMIKPYERFYELYLRHKRYSRTEPAEQQTQVFSTDDYRDLQTWYNLTWIGMESRKRPEIARLFKKGKNFSETDKLTVLKESLKILSEIIPLHKQMFEAGQIELSTSPFYHPILPLLCDNYIAQISTPGLPLPQIRFTHPEDAEAQVIRGLQYFEKLFGQRPKGMWPSEGSVSVQALEIIARQGVEWVATDEGVLLNTLKSNYSHTRIYQPYLLDTGKNQINIFFRDHYLSDSIGFVYSNWSADRAVSDLVNRVHAIRKLLIDIYKEDALQNFVIPIILDGENCWEYYEGDGKPFLRKLYSALSEDELIETVTLSEILQRNKKREKLTDLHPGSWINSNFNIWIGAEEDNKAWDILAQTREFLVKEQKKGIYTQETLNAAWEQIYIAEGSDWNWWYGDEHSSANDMEFDQLYREHLMEVYRLLGQDIPTVLYQTIKRIHFDRFVITRPKNFIQPVIDGRDSHFYEWVGAAVYEMNKIPQTAMHQVTRILDRLHVGFDRDNLYLRMDFLTRPEPMTEFILAVKTPSPQTIVISPLRGVIERFEMKEQAKIKSNLKPNFKWDRVFEVGIPFKDLKVKPGDSLGFQILIKLNGQPLEEFPRISLVEIKVPDENFELLEWSV